MRDLMIERLGELRYEPTDKWLRAAVGGVGVVDSTGALLVWEPRRIVPSYAVPVSDLAATLAPVPSGPPSDAPVLSPGIPFAAHSTAGQAYDVVVGDRTLPGAGFMPSTLDGCVVLDFTAFDRWREEEDEQVLTGLVAFYDEKVDVVVDGQLRSKPSGPIADAIREEFGLD